MQVSVKNQIDQFTPALNSLQRKQLPYATARALTATGREVAKDLQSRIRSRFEAPKPFTVNSPFSTSASKKAVPIKVTVGIKDKDPPKGASAARYLSAQVSGRARRAKRFERALKAKGSLRAGEFAIPGRAMKLDRFGNISRAAVSQILKGLDVPGGKYVTVRGNGFAGVVYRTRARSFVALVYTRAPTYAPKLDFLNTVRASVATNFPIQMRRALDQAIATAVRDGQRGKA